MRIAFFLVMSICTWMIVGGRPAYSCELSVSVFIPLADKSMLASSPELTYQPVGEFEVTLNSRERFDGTKRFRFRDGDSKRITVECGMYAYTVHVTGCALVEGQIEVIPNFVQSIIAYPRLAGIEIDMERDFKVTVLTRIHERIGGSGYTVTLHGLGGAPSVRAASMEDGEFCATVKTGVYLAAVEKEDHPVFTEVIYFFPGEVSVLFDLGAKKVEVTQERTLYEHYKKIPRRVPANRCVAVSSHRNP